MRNIAGMIAIVVLCCACATGKKLPPWHVAQDGQPPGTELGVYRSATDGGSLPPTKSPAQVIITEIMANPSAVLDSKGEWFEIYNAGSAPVDLGKWLIRDDKSNHHVIPGSMVVKAGGYLVLGNNKVMSDNGGAKVHYSYGSGWYLANATDQITLYDAALRLVDRVAYDVNAGWKIPPGASISRKSLKGPAGPANWCVETQAWKGSAGDKGTPGLAAGCAP